MNAVNQEKKLRNTGFICFFMSGICSISAGIVVSLLRERYGFEYGLVGSLLSFMNIGNLLAGFAVAYLANRLGVKWAAMLPLGYALGYFVMSGIGVSFVLAISFFALGLAKGSTINLCTNLVGEHSENKTKGMNLMHACYALGALICPFVIALASRLNVLAPTLCLGAVGLALWLLFRVNLKAEHKESKTRENWSFLKSKKFWILTGLLFCQNAAEQSVNGWLVTYFKDFGILTGMLSAYTVTVMWSATLVARLLIAFVFPIKKAGRAMVLMGIFSAVFYALLMGVSHPVLAIVLLFSFAFSMAGLNPTAVANAGRMMSTESMGVMLPVASLGAIVMPYIIGLVAEYAGIRGGMMLNLVPCVGLIAFAAIVSREKNTAEQAV